MVTVLSLVMLANSHTLSAQYAASASTEVYNFDPFTDRNLLDLFYNALQQGRQFPTAAEFAAAGFDPIDLEFVRSHVRRAEVIDDQAGQLNTSIKNTRRFWMNTPMGSSKLTGGYPNTNTGDDTFSLWNYTYLFGSWNHGLFQAPGCWVDAAHQNGTDILCGVKFFESWTAGSGDASYTSLITKKNADGTFKYVEPMINILLFFGTDGINYNWEDTSYLKSDVIAFHKALYKMAEKKGFRNFHIGLYTANSSLRSDNVNAIFGNASGRTADTFLNYTGGDFNYNSFSSSLTTARNALGTTDGLYAGAWIVSMDRSWTGFKGNDMGMVLWGEHGTSRFWSYNVGTDASSFQSNLQALYERAFSGGNRNPANRPAMSNTGNSWSWSGTTPPLSTFGGISTYFPERSAIQGRLPFHTYFNTGTGEVYNYKGRKTSGPWYNLSAQDIVPTYRWLVRNAGTTTAASNLQPEFTIDDAYMGGACLRISGTARTAGTDIVLFRTQLSGNSGTPYARLAVKSGAEGVKETGLYLIVKVGSAWKEYPVGTTTSRQWEEKHIVLDGISHTDQISHVGLRVKGTGSYKMLVGMLELNDDVQVEPASLKNLRVDVRGETSKKLSVKLAWQVDALGGERSEYGMLFNDEANIDHFEVLYKSGKDGRVSVISHVRGWAAFVGNIPVSDGERPFVGVRAVATDLKTYSRPMWAEVPRNENVPTDDQGDGPIYGTSTINTESEGYEVAISTRYLTSVSTTGASGHNLNYHGVADTTGTNYIFVSDQVLKVSQGDYVTLNYKYLSSSDGLQYCTMKTYADWNANGYFEGSTDELLVEQGKAETGNSSLLVPFSFRVPTNAVRGNSRLRIVFSDAWAGHPGPTGYTVKGFTIDFPVTITGDNAERTVENSRDEGIADEPDSLVASLLGDVNNDGAVTIADVTMAVNLILGKESAMAFSYANADVNDDGDISIADVTAIVNMILGK